MLIDLLYGRIKPKAKPGIGRVHHIALPSEEIAVRRELLKNKKHKPQRTIASVMTGLQNRWRIYEFIANSDKPVSCKAIRAATGMSGGAVSTHTLALFSEGKIVNVATNSSRPLYIISEQQK